MVLLQISSGRRATEQSFCVIERFLGDAAQHSGEFGNAIGSLQQSYVRYILRRCEPFNAISVFGARIIPWPPISLSDLSEGPLRPRPLD